MNSHWKAGLDQNSALAGLHLLTALGRAQGTAGIQLLSCCGSDGTKTSPQQPGIRFPSFQPQAFQYLNQKSKKFQYTFALNLWVPGVCPHLRHLGIDTTCLNRAPRGHLRLGKPQQQPNLKKSLSTAFCTYRQVNPRHGSFPRGRERTQAAMAPPGTRCSRPGAQKPLTSRYKCRSGEERVAG